MLDDDSLGTFILNGFTGEFHHQIQLVLRIREVPDIEALAVLVDIVQFKYGNYFLSFGLFIRSRYSRGNCFFTMHIKNEGVQISW